MQAFRIAQFLAVGYVNFGTRGFAANERSFTLGVLDVDLKGLHYIVTGATSGLGRVTAGELAAKGATVHMVCRNVQRGEKVREEIMSETGNSAVELHICDISSLHDVARFAETWGKKQASIAALVNNAGVMVHEVKESRDGIELTFATHTLGTFALTEMLRPWLEGGGRVITVSSGGMLTQPLVVDKFGGDDLRRGNTIDGETQYSRCKRQQVALTEHWARKWSQKGIFWASMHPGWASTPGLEASMQGFYNATRRQQRTAAEGADTIIYLSVAEEAVKYSSGEFFFDRAPAGKHLWMSGTNYSTSDVDKLVNGLESIIEENGFKIPS